MSIKKVMTQADLSIFFGERSAEVKNLYITRNYTARQLADHYGIMFSPAFQKSCHNIIGPKGAGRGGARLGAGNKREGREKRKAKNYATIAVRLPNDIVKKISDSGLSYTNYIERAILFYYQATQTLKDLDLEK